MNLAEFTSVPSVFEAESTEGNSKADTSGGHHSRNITLSSGTPQKILEGKGK
jgi:hypothetical protein